MQGAQTGTGVRIGFIGAGLVGNTLGILLQRAGYRITGFTSKTMDSALAAAERAGAKAFDDLLTLVSESDIIFITTVDDAISTTAEKISDSAMDLNGKAFVHTSGALGAKALEAVRGKGGEAASFHPLQTFADVETALELLPGSLVAIEGDKKITWALDGIARAIGARPYVLDSETKVLYHAAAVVSCNFLTALESVAVDMLEAVGIPREDGLGSLMPLIKGTIRNLDNVGLPGALTGPIDRGDIKVVESHIGAIRERIPKYEEFYRLMARRTVEVARDKGRLDDGQVKEFMALLA